MSRKYIVVFWKSIVRQVIVVLLGAIVFIFLILSIHYSTDGREEPNQLLFKLSIPAFFFKLQQQLAEVTSPPRHGASPPRS